MTDRQILEERLQDAIPADLFDELGDCLNQWTDEELLTRIEREETFGFANTYRIHSNYLTAVQELEQEAMFQMSK